MNIQTIHLTASAADKPNQFACQEIGAEDLPLHCPTDRMPLWNSHPRVFLPLEKTGEVRCPYCGTLYTLKKASPGGF
ncbi:MAG TPA: zinc-finger domain-containing protein [Gammaproteobacteria bacterium]|nr:zinc-finger domain-containing protein [Gammaproteobacteria bacterium]